MNKKWIEENKQYIENLELGLKRIKEIGNKLTDFKIDVFSSPWYINIMEIYIPQAFKYHDDVAALDYNISQINELNNIWMRSSFMNEKLF